jgi:hypothetical protein
MKSASGNKLARKRSLVWLEGGRDPQRVPLVPRKREPFQLLYDTGRLCGDRAAATQALLGAS